MAASLVGKAAEMATLVALATVVPRALGPRDYGHFAVPLTVVTLGSLAMTLGGPTVMARYVPAAPAGQRTALARALGRRLATGRAVQCGALALGALVATTADPARFPPLETTLVVLALVLNVATTLALQVTLGLGRAGPWSARYPLQNAVLVAAVLVLYPAFGTVGATAAVVVAAAVAAALAAAVLAPVARADVAPVPVPPGAIRFGALHATGAALVQCAHRGGVVAVAVLAGSAVETGYAALAIGIALGASYAVLQTFTVTLPHLSARAAGHRTDLDLGFDHGPTDDRHDHAGTGDPAGEAVLRRLAGGLLAAVIPAALGVAALLDTLAPAAFGSRYASASAALGPALAVVVLAPLSALTVQAAALRLQPGTALASGVATLAGFLAGVLVLVPTWAASGATLAALIGVAAGAVVAVRRLPGAAGGPVVAASFLGAAAVLGVAAVS